MKRHPTLSFLTNKADWLIAGAGAVMVMAAAGMAGTIALQSHSARAASVEANLPFVLPSVQVAAADTAATDGNKDDMRARFRARMEERMKEHGEEHAPGHAKDHPMTDKHLTTDQVRDIVAGHLAMRGNANLKVGKVTAKDSDIVAVDVVTKTGALVETREISTKTGLPAALSARLEDGHMGGHPFMRGMMHHRMMAGGMGGHMSGPEGMRHGGHDGMGKDGGHRDLALTVDQAKKLAEARLIMMGNPHLKVGAVKEKDADTISVDIVASDNSLVMQHLIDRHTGRPIHEHAPS